MLLVLNFHNITLPEKTQWLPSRQALTFVYTQSCVRMFVACAITCTMCFPLYSAKAEEKKDLSDSLYTYRARITDVYDGDTVTADIDLGLSIWARGEKMRLYGIDTPEIRGGKAITKQKAKEARDFLRSQVLNRPVILRTIKDRKGKYGRYLTIIYKDGVNINELLVKKGYEVKYKK